MTDHILDPVLQAELQKISRTPKSGDDDQPATSTTPSHQRILKELRDWQSAGYRGDLLACRGGSNTACHSDWNRAAPIPDDELLSYLQGGCGVGLRCKSIIAVDIEGSPFADLILEELCRRYPGAPIRSREGSPSRAMLLGIAPGSFIKTRKLYHVDPGMAGSEKQGGLLTEFLGNGTQLHIIGPRQDKGGVWLNWTEVPPLEDLPAITEEELDALLVNLQTLLLKAGAKTTITQTGSKRRNDPDGKDDWVGKETAPAALLGKALDVIDKDCAAYAAYEQWLQLATALAVMSGGSPDVENAVADCEPPRSAGDRRTPGLFRNARAGRLDMTPGQALDRLCKWLAAHVAPGRETEASDIAAKLRETEQGIAAARGELGPLPVDPKDLPPKGVVLQRASDCTPEATKWLWSDYIPSGKITIFAGPPKLGKTTMALKLAAVVSRGGKFQDGTTSPKGKVLIWSGEDDYADTILPRLMAEGAELSQVSFVTGVQHEKGETDFDPARHMAQLEKAIAELGDVALLVMDPLVSAVTGDMSQNNNVRRSLQPLKLLAERQGCALIGITHFNKNSKGSSPLDRVNGSVAFGALARAIFFFAQEEADKAEDPLNPSKLFLRGGGNLSESGGGWKYEIAAVMVQGAAGEDIKTTRIAMGARISGDAKSILAEAEGLAGGRDEGSGTVAEAMSFLRKFLGDGAKTPKEAYKTAKDEGFSRKTIERAKLHLGVSSGAHRSEDGRVIGWFWELPAAAADFAAIEDKPAGT